MTRRRNVASAAALALAIACASLTAGAAPAHDPLTAAERAERQALLRRQIHREMPAYVRQLANASATIPTRTIANAALADIVVDGDAAAAARDVDALLATQDNDPSSPTYGDIPWERGPSKVHDANGNSFASEPLGPLLLAYGPQLQPRTRAALLARIPAFVAGLRRHNVPVSYTNVFVMQSVALILLGEAAHDASVADDGYAAFDRWLADVRAHGVGEYDSPTYYGVDLDSLTLAYRFCARPGCKATIARGLDYLWTDVEANLFDGAVLAGAHSRDYDFLFGHGLLDEYLAFEERGVPVPPRSPDPNSLALSYLLLDEGPDGYHPSDAIRAIARRPHVFEARFDDKLPPRYDWVTDGVALGSANGDHGEQDKQIAANLAPASLPAITVVPDKFDAPYGHATEVDRAGHVKPVHLALHPVSVQRDGLLLATLDLDPSKANGTSFATNVTLPLDVPRIDANGTPAALTAPTELPLKDDAVVGVRGVRGAVAIRILHVDALQDKAPQIMLKSDATGIHYHVARLAIYHARTTITDAPHHLRVALLIAAAPAANDADLATLEHNLATAKLDDHTTGGVWTMGATVGTTTLTVARATDAFRIVSRTIDGTPAPEPRFAIDGKEIALP
ncbi:MAG: hypothetical protein JO225_02815 [Candidatus Eremiobacteraeota bacterium]|nr:hypothetical protein [Candidatus Eremiobacteraeota bacterium]